ncbi:nitrous oxide reductase accessory protein NosL [Siminovitchia sp. FSL H7-0308]|uniref:nitrous oxide reductase accessory protein NosL n=1 Tax=Siminovitchia sp. FSL H7-0308 TaxID=2921432 RepID=UPI0030EEED7F
MKQKRMYLFILLLSISIVAAACGKKEAAVEPKEVDEGVDKCDICHMNVADDQFATQIALKDGETLMFDDIGCMVKDWLLENDDKETEAVFVRDFDTKEWISYDDATYVYDASFKTPMAYGMYSFKDKADAEALIEKEGKGQLLTAEDLKSHSWKRNKEMMDHGHQDHGNGGSHDKGGDEKEQGDDHEHEVHGQDDGEQHE